MNVAISHHEKTTWKEYPSETTSVNNLISTLFYITYVILRLNASCSFLRTSGLYGLSDYSLTTEFPYSKT